MAKVLGGKQRRELAALLKVKKPTKEQMARIGYLSPGQCPGCEKTKEVRT